jgi:Ca2+/Na+ antiporter
MLVAGAGLFITTVVLGSVSMTAPTRLTRRPFLRDVGFYILACCGLAWVVYQQAYVYVAWVGM